MTALGEIDVAAAVTAALDAALGEVRRQGGPDYLLAEAEQAGLRAASMSRTLYKPIVDDLRRALADRDERIARLEAGLREAADALEHVSVHTEFGDMYPAKVAREAADKLRALADAPAPGVDSEPR